MLTFLVIHSALIKVCCSCDLCVVCKENHEHCSRRKYDKNEYGNGGITSSSLYTFMPSIQFSGVKLILWIVAEGNVCWEDSG